MAEEKLQKPQQSESKEKLLEEYNKVVDQIEISAINLTSLDFDIKPSFFELFDDKKTKFSFDVGFLNIETPEFDGLNSEVVEDVLSNFASAQLYANVFMKNGRKTLFSLKAEYLLIYTNIAGCEPQAVEAFIERVGRFTCYPYFRSLFSTIDGCAGTRMPPLPVLK